MRKKLLALTIVTLSVFATVTGCKNKNNSDDNTEPATEVESTAEEETVEYKATLTDYSSLVTLADYKGISIDVDSAEVTDEQIKTQIDAIIADNPEYEKITDRKVNSKDTIHLIYEGSINGEVFEGGSTGDAGTDYTIGGNYIKDLNDQLIGLECGKEYDLKCTFPEDYGKEELNGKEAVFKVKVEYIRGKEIEVEWNDEYVNKITSGQYKTVADIETALKSAMKTQNEQTQTKRYQAALISTIMDKCEFGELPKDKLEEAYSSIHEYFEGTYKSMAEQYSMSYEEVLKANGTSEEEIEKNCREQAELQTKYLLMTCTIAQKENISISQEEFDTNVKNYRDTSGLDMSKAEFVQKYGELYLLETFLGDKVANFLYENNKMNVTETTK